MVVCTMSIPINLRRLKKFKNTFYFVKHTGLVYKIYIYILKYFNLLRLIGIDIVQTMMSVSTLYIFLLSGHMQKIQTCFWFVYRVRPVSSTKTKCFFKNFQHTQVYRFWYCADNHVSINTAPPSNLKLYAQN